jgi:hypothetical protein
MARGLAERIVCASFHIYKDTRHTLVYGRLFSLRCIHAVYTVDLLGSLIGRSRLPLPHSEALVRGPVL